MNHLMEYDGKQFQDVTKEKLDLGELDSEEDKKQQEKLMEKAKPLLERIEVIG